LENFQVGADQVTMLASKEPHMRYDRWTQAYLEMLQVDDPARYEQMRKAGTLIPTAKAAGERAAGQFENLIAQMRKRDPGPKGALGQAQHLMVLDSQATELVLADLYQPRAAAND
jgi:hypothetical protein